MIVEKDIIEAVAKFGAFFFGEIFVFCVRIEVCRRFVIGINILTNLFPILITKELVILS